MPAKLQDVGNGVKMVDFSDDSATRQLSETLGLIDLTNRIRQAPVDSQLKDAELKLKTNELNQIDVKNDLLFQQLQSQKNGEQRSQTEFINSQLLKAREAYQQGGKEMGDLYLRSILPNFQSVEQGKGKIVIGSPGVRPFTINTGITDPKELEALEKSRVTEWNESKKTYSTLYDYGNKIPAALALGTAEGDRSALILKAKMEDPTGRVTENDYNTILKNPSVTEWTKNLFERSLNTKGPLFGDQSSETRRQFNEATKTIVDESRKTFVNDANFFLRGRVLADNLDPYKVMSPAGDVDLNYLGYDPKTGSVGGPLEPGGGPGVPPANRALGTPNQPTPEQVKQKTLNDLTLEVLGNIVNPRKSK